MGSRVRQSVVELAGRGVEGAAVSSVSVGAMEQLVGSGEGNMVGAIVVALDC